MPSKLELHGCWLLRVDVLEDELVEQVVVLRSQRERLDWLAVEHDLERAANIGRAGCEASSSARRAMMVACVVPQVPEASFFDGDEVEGLADGLGGLSPLEQACAARPVVSMAALAPVE